MSLYRHYAPVIDWLEKKTKSVKYKKAEIKPVVRSDYYNRLYDAYFKGWE